MMKTFGLILFVLMAGFSAQSQIVLPICEDFEGANALSIQTNTTSIAGIPSWSFETDQPIGRLRTAAGAGYYSSGSQGITLDADPSGALTINYAIWNTDLSNYNTASDVVLMSFTFMEHGDELHANDRVWIRGSNTDAWIEIYDWNTPSAGNGVFQTVTDLNLTAALATNAQNFSATTQIRFGQEDNFPSTSLTASDGFSFDDVCIRVLLPDDAGISAFVGPVNPISVGANNIDATIYNFGSDTLRNANIEWSVNGANQTPFAWTGVLPLDSSDTQTIGNFNFASGLSTVRAWTSLPNGNVDLDNSNDTLEIVFCTPLSGAYTVGTAGDFTTIAELGNILSNCGVNGPVTVTIDPGTYNDRLILDHIPGTSPTNTVTIDGVDSTLVTIANSIFSNIYLNGSDYITLQNMTLINTGTLDAYGIQLRDSAMWNTITNMHIIMPIDPTNTDIIGINASNLETLGSSEGTNAYWTTISNNHIEGGYYSIRLEGASANRNVGNIITNNLITTSRIAAIYIDDQDSMTITWNVIDGATTVNTGGDGIYCFDIQMFDISYNTVLNIPDWGIYVADGNFSTDGTPTSRGRVVGNMVSSLTDYGMYFDDFEQTDIFHNTVYNQSGTTGAIRINDFDQLDIRNNIFMSETDFAFESDEAVAATTNTLNYNSYWTPASNANFVDDGPTVQADLAAWQAASATLNVNSVELDPIFVNAPSDLHVSSAALNDLGDGTVGVMIDIDNEARPMGAQVDLGADEFEPASEDATFVAFLRPTAGCGDSSTAVEVIIRNLGANTITNMNIDATVTGATTATLNFNYTGPLASSEFDTIVIGSINTYAGGTYNITGAVTLSGDVDNTNDSSTIHTFNTIPFEPVGIDAVVCGNTGYLTAQSGYNYNWYDAPTGGTLVGSGDSLLVPSVSTQSTYYVEYGPLSNTLQTTYAAGNGCTNGNMFDVSTTTSANISGFNLNATQAAGTAITVNVYYIANSSYVGNETTAGAWTSAGTYNLTSAGTGNPTNLTLASGIPLVAGQTTAIYIDCDAQYTNGTNTYTDGVITINTGAGFCTAFSGPIASRTFNGDVIYGGAPCSSIRTAVTATSLPAPNVDLGLDTSLCGDSLILDAVAMGTYQWSTTATTQTIDVVASGDYAVTVTGTNGCQGIDTVNVNFYQLNASVIVTQPVLCSGDSTGTATGVGTNGVGGYTYMWSDGQSTDIATDLPSGVYTVTIMDSQGCMDTASVTFTNPTTITSTTAVSSNYNGAEITCIGAADGEATNTSTGGTGTLTYLWSNSQTTMVATGLDAGTAYVSITDANGCTVLDSVILTNPTAITSTTAVSSSYNGAEITCIGATDGEATNTSTGGTGTLTYLWSNSQTTMIATGLGAGTAYVSITDDNGCIVLDSVILTNPTAITSTTAVSSNYNGAEITCAGEADGEATNTSTGGTGALTYLWSNSQTTMIATGLGAGTAYVSITDANGCMTMDSVALTEPTAVVASAVDNGGGSATASGAGGTVTAGYSFIWDDGQATATALGLTGPTHCVTVSDANGCSDTTCLPIILAVTTLDNNSNISIFPNPTSGNAYAALDLETSSDVQIELLDLTGKVISTSLYNNVQADRIELLTSELPSGVYLVKFTVESKVSTQRLIIQRQ